MRQLAQDMLSVVPECLSGYKKLIDEGYAQDFGTSLKTEHRISSAANSAVSPDAVESRREGIRQRGQTQSRG